MPNKRIGVVILVGLALIVLFLLMPRQPGSVRSAHDAPVNADSLELIQAIQLVQGTDPMKGIGMLRQLVEKDSTNLEAQYQLGLFSIQSGQMDKAVNRFETILRMDSTYTPAMMELAGLRMQEGNNAAALKLFRGCLNYEPNLVAAFFVAQLEEQAGNLQEALVNYDRVLKMTTDSIVTDTIKSRIENINKKLNP
jgi:tetratricopeptide (TPR) repeat protein